MEGIMSQKHKTVEDIVVPALWPDIYEHTLIITCAHICTHQHKSISDTQTQAHKQMAL